MSPPQKKNRGWGAPKDPLTHPSPAAGPVIMSLEEKMEADARSIYVGNVSAGEGEATGGGWGGYLGGGGDI